MVWSWRRKAAEVQGPAESEQQLLVEEIRKAHHEWYIARKRFEYAADKDQIDYAIYALEAAEKRYEMLLKQAKRTQVRAYDFDTYEAMGG